MALVRIKRSFSCSKVKAYLEDLYSFLQLLLLKCAAFDSLSEINKLRFTFQTQKNAKLEASQIQSQ